MLQTKLFVPDIHVNSKSLPAPKWKHEATWQLYTPSPQPTQAHQQETNTILDKLDQTFKEKSLPERYEHGFQLKPNVKKFDGELTVKQNPTIFISKFHISEDKFRRYDSLTGHK